ncbi:MAG: hypothetical protein WCW36_00105 [Candidatus Paceibacterota bacterium]
MHVFPFVYHLIDSSIGSALSVSLAIFFGAIFLEDVTTVIVGLLAADGVIPIPIAIGSLYAGVIAGDISFYLIGLLASTHRRFGRYVDHDLVAPIRAWLETRFILTVFSARFIPGTRVATYTASGFFRSRFITFICTVIVATLIWITLLFSVAFWFGGATVAWLGPVRWVIAGVFLLALFFIGRHNVLTYRAKKDEMYSKNIS